MSFIYKMKKKYHIVGIVPKSNRKSATAEANKRKRENRRVIQEWTIQSTRIYMTDYFFD